MAFAVQWRPDRVTVFGLGAAEYAEISASAAEQPRPDDLAEAELAALRDRHGTLLTLAEMPATQALDMLVAKANRKRE